MKYELTEHTLTGGRTLYRIRAVRALPLVSVGDLGGYVQYEWSLSQEGNSWVYGDAQVYGAAWVYGDAQVYGAARVCGYEVRS